MGEVVRRHDRDSAERLRSEYAFLLKSGIEARLLAACCEEALQSGVTPHALLLAQGRLSALTYMRLLEAEFTPHTTGPGRITEVVDGLAGRPSEVAAAIASIRARGNIPLLLSGQHIDFSEPLQSTHLRVERAANGLRRQHPELSAGTPFALWQAILFPVALGLAFGGLAVLPIITLGLLATSATLVFVLIVGLRTTLLLVALLEAPRRITTGRIPDEDLPVYSVLVPLYQEADVVPELLQSLERLDYPTERLDILLIVEDVDQATRDAMARLRLPIHFRVIVVPTHPPRTKPKALNYALRLSRGEFVVIYDAEDAPEPDQLRRAVAGFRGGPAGLMCQQARLVPDNRKPGWFARQFMLEYGAQFDAILPALARLGLPIPLGGTSNHFPRAVLDEIGGWDAWNVTEDADLGTRIARHGGIVRILNSPTYEEAPERFGVWIRQRTRWLKGFMQTWAVHMRSPRRLRRELGTVGFLAFNALVGGLVLSALVHPIFIGYLIWEGMQGTLLTWPDTWGGDVIYAAALLNLAVGYAAGMGTAALGAVRRGNRRLLLEVPLIPIYWMAISLAAYRAVWQLIRKPHLWEKTPHRPRALRGAKRPPARR